MELIEKIQNSTKKTETKKLKSQLEKMLKNYIKAVTINPTREEKQRIRKINDLRKQELQKFKKFEKELELTRKRNKKKIRLRNRLKTYEELRSWLLRPKEIKYHKNEVTRRRRNLNKKPRKIYNLEKRNKLEDDFLNKTSKVFWRKEFKTQRGKLFLYSVYARNSLRITVTEFLEEVETEVLRILRENMNSGKIQFEVILKMGKIILVEGVEMTDVQIRNLKTKFMEIFIATDLNDFYERAKSKLVSEFHQIQNKELGSNYELKYIIKLNIYSVKIINLERPDNQNPELNINPLVEQAGSFYFYLSDFWKNKKALINPQNVDERCFLWACTIGKYKPRKDNGRITKYLKEKNKEFSTQTINFPMSLNYMKRFEKWNNIKVNILCTENN